VVELLNITELGRGNPVLVVGLADPGEACPDLDELLGLRVGQRAQQHCIQHAEDGGIGADAERHGDNDDSSEAGPLDHLAQRETQILEQNCHFCLR